MSIKTNKKNINSHLLHGVPANNAVKIYNVAHVVETRCPPPCKSFAPPGECIKVASQPPRIDNLIISTAYISQTPVVKAQLSE